MTSYPRNTSGNNVLDFATTVGQKKAKQRRLGRGIYLLPSFFTVMAMFCGFYAIIAGIKGMFDVACFSGYLAMLLDGLDGRIARITRTQSDFGAELDSLSDMLCFGVTPAVLMYLWSLHQLGKIGWLASFVYVVAVALRLARFNIQDSDAAKHFFQGLSSTAGAGFSLGLMYVGDLYNVQADTWVPPTLATLSVLTSFLMVSNVPYRSFKKLDAKGKIPFMTIFILVLLIVLITVKTAEVLLTLFTLYFLMGPFEYLVNCCRRR